VALIALFKLGGDELRAGAAHHLVLEAAHQIRRERLDTLRELRLNRKQIERIAAGLARRLYALPWLTRPPIGLEALSKLVGAAAAAGVAT
jgi:hypothetical protein